jgi:hypothetical protein
MGLGSKYARKIGQNVEEQILRKGLTNAEEQLMRRGTFEVRNMTKGERTIGRSVLQQLGRTEALRFLENASRRVLRKLQRDSAAWTEAFRHIKAHFVEDFTKPRHTVYVEKFRSRAALEDLFEKALQHPDRQTRLSRETFEGVATGKPVAVIEVTLDEVIGRTSSGASCRILRLITDLTGRPLTAFPVEHFLVF